MFNLYPVFQPIVHTKKPDRFLGYESLIRGTDKSNRTVYPAELFTFARENDKVVDLDHEARVVGLEVGYNLLNSGELLFVNCLPEGLSKLQLPSFVPYRQVVLEITEHNRVHFPIERLNELRRKGVRIAIDDFGTGYSNFQLIEQLRPEFVKLAHTFAAKIDQSTVSYNLLLGMNELLTKAGIEIIIEGIERKEQAQIIKEIGIPYAQGYWYYSPATIDKYKLKFAK